MLSLCYQPLVAAWTIILFCLVDFATAAAAAPLPKQTLPLGDINVVVVTDVHSWVASHVAHEPRLNADYGDVLSFYERLREQAPDQDFFFVMNGDFMDGTGLSTYPPSHLIPILEKMPWDAVNMGNHELYQNSTIQLITQANGFVEHWGGNYLTSNVLFADTMEPIGNRYTYLYGSNTNSTILTFGFLFNFIDNCALTEVEPVQETVKSDWFQNVLKEGSFDAILVLAHMDHQDPLLNVILDAMRALVGPDMPIQFITGHSHVRGYTVLDDAAVSFEAGHFLDTVGFASFPLKRQEEKEDISNLFQHVFLDANVHALRSTLGVKSLPTPSGAALTDLIRTTQKELGLLDVLGCSTQSYVLENGLNKSHSLWAFYMKEIVPNYFSDNSILVESSGDFRYSLFKGRVRVDDVIAVTPFNDTYYRIAAQVPGSVLQEVLRDDGIVRVRNGKVWRLPTFVVSQDVDPTQNYNLYSVGFTASLFAEKIRNATGDPVDPKKKYDRDGAPLTTGTVWKDYVVNHMHCKSAWRSGFERTAKPSQYLFLISLGAVIILMGWRYYRERREKRRGYEAFLPEVDVQLQQPSYNTIV